ncbi:hypothetical protein K450DRAFT_257920 [Umbelopsis ramanniana AG]|uniref:Uncharacterized protein n=1 Tax=Umbelopsis ramanniana AG TaxID=1314678 RepID=A0AAD5E2J2_UMBRA|nr:uncharacterized protein K450DRAFT_257920 [Umbelopsis ramanniana AG]KAI8576261.1 hypothetical protein K450DRAFT_257920 [Umbelopsis ramanniana AG]
MEVNSSPNEKRAASILYSAPSVDHDGGNKPDTEADIHSVSSTNIEVGPERNGQAPIQPEEAAQEQPSRAIKVRRFIIKFIQTYWFLMGLAVVIVLAWRFPGVAKKDGVIHSEWSIKWGAVIVIFLISGLSLRTRTLAKTVVRVRLHLMIQIISLIIIPFTVYGIALLFATVNLPINHMLLLGLVIAGCTPTTVSSNVVMTRNAKGNEASALMNAALGNVLGIFVSPALMSVFEKDTRIAPSTNAHGSLDYIDVLKNLGLTILVPLVVGQIIQWLFPRQVAAIKEKCRLGDINSLALLALVWSVFSDAIASNSFSAVGATDIVAIAVINAGFYISFSLFCMAAARLPLPRSIKTPEWVKKLRYSRADTVAIMYCGATKTVAMGVPLVSVLYQDAPAGIVGVLTTPLLLYHVEQLILGNIELFILKAWVERGEKKQEKQSLLPATGDDEHDIGLHEIDNASEPHTPDATLPTHNSNTPPHY